jgi:hypothetical protein
MGDSGWVTVAVVGRQCQWLGGSVSGWAAVAVDGVAVVKMRTGGCRWFFEWAQSEQCGASWRELAKKQKQNKVLGGIFGGFVCKQWLGGAS